MVAGAHYLSDVLVGAAVGLVVATLTVEYFAERKRRSSTSEAATALKADPQRDMIRAA
jgi:membrane-associated phospholipid phosphatase